MSMSQQHSEGKLIGIWVGKHGHGHLNGGDGSPMDYDGHCLTYYLMSYYT